MGQFYRLMTKVLHGFEPETAHELSLKALETLQSIGLSPCKKAHDPALAQTLETASGALYVPNVLGLAAGYDKNAAVALCLLQAGFGFVECGTVTPKPQAGNPKPRLFRLSEDQAIINRMGFNNEGLDRFSAHLSYLATRRKPEMGPVGANIGANKDSQDRRLDYVLGLKALWGQSSYFTINISSPNTPGLRALQGRDQLDQLLGAVREARLDLARVTEINMPIFLKIAPDLSETEIADTVEQALHYGLDGMIVSNTTLSRPAGLMSKWRDEAGGLSGQPLQGLAFDALKIAAKVSNRRLILISAGGIASGKEAYARLRAGASLVQIYSSLIYHGPDLILRIRQELNACLKADGFAHISEAIGLDL